MTPKPPQKDAEILFRCIVEQENKLKEFAKKQMLQMMKNEMQQLREDWFKSFKINLTQTQS